MKETKLKIEYLPSDSLTEYSRNARKHTEYDVNAIKQSINQFGMCDPIGVWSDKNIIVEGHGRYKALTELGYKQIPCVRLDHLTDEQRKMYTLVHNKTAENSSWDDELLNDELSQLDDLFDIGDFGFDILLDDDYNEFEDYKPNERERTANEYNLRLFDSSRATGFYQMPTLKPCNVISDNYISFNYVLSNSDKKCGVHFFIDDYQFERIWNDPQSYIEKLKGYESVLSPDFSLYTDMSRAQQIYNIYRSRLVGQLMQDNNITVIPTVSWADKESFIFCFDGLPQNSTVAISTIGCHKGKAKEIWINGVKEMILRLHPNKIIIYGELIECDIDFCNIELINIKNTNTSKFRVKE